MAVKAPLATKLADYIEVEFGKVIGQRLREASKAARAKGGIPFESPSHTVQKAGGNFSDSQRRKAYADKFKSRDSRDWQIEQQEVGQIMRAVAKSGGAFTPQNFAAATQIFDPSKAVIKAWEAHGKSRSEMGLQKALGETSFIDGGAMVPPQFVEEVIEFLRAKVVIRALGARVVPMPRGTLTFPYASTGIVASNTIENTASATSQPTFGTFQLTAKKIRAVTPISNDLLNDASPAADQFVQQDLVASLRVLEDFNYLRGSGTGGQMRGLRNLAQNNLLASNASSAAGGSTTTEIIHDLVSVLSSIEQNNITIENGGWVLAPRVKLALMSLRDGIGNFYFKEEMLQGHLWGYNFGSTTAQPINLDTTAGLLSGKESEILFADFDRIIIGDTQELSVEPYRGGAYYDSTTSQIVSGISNDQTVVVGQLRSDINARYRGQEITNLSQVTWGA